MDIISSGTAFISSGTSTDLLVVQEGALHILNAGVAQTVVLSDGGKAAVSRGGTLHMCNISGGGTASVLNNGYAEDVTVENGGLYLVSSGGTTHKSIVDSGGTQIVYKDTMATSATVLNGGILRVSSGGFVRTPDVSQGGTMSLWQSLADRAQVRGSAEINFGATLNNVLVLEGGRITVVSSGYAYNAEVSSGGTLIASGAGKLNSAAVFRRGSVIVEEKGICNNATVNTDGRLMVSSGGTAKNIVENGGYVEVAYGADATFVSNTISGMVISGTATIHSGTIANDTFITYVISSPSVPPYFTAVAYGRLEIYSGGTANNTTVSSGALAIYDGGVVNGAALNEGFFDVYSGGTANNIVLNSTFSSMIPARSFISSGGTGTNITVNEGARFVVDGGCADGVTVNAGGEFEVWRGGTATNIVWTPCEGQIELDDDVYVTFASSFSGVYYGVDDHLLSSAAVMTSKTVSSGGTMCIMSGGTADGTVICSEGELSVCSGGTAANTTVSGFYSDLVVYSGGIVINTTLLDGGGLYLHNCAEGAKNTTVSSGGGIHISGATVDGAVVCSGGRLDFHSGKLTGKLTFESGATVSVHSYEEPILDFDLAQTEAGASALVNDLSIIYGTPVYTLTVSWMQTSGDYSLADGASGFSGTLTVVNVSGDTLGTLAVGQTLKTQTADYTLNLSSGSLSVAVVSNLVPVMLPSYLTGCFAGEGQAMLAKELNGAAIIYDNGSVWGGLTLESGWHIAATGDFNADGMDDILKLHDSGLVTGELSNGDSSFKSKVLNFKQSGWDILATGDFDADGADDVLIANPTAASATVGLLGYWKGGTEWTLINGYSPEWEMLAAGDFNGDGKCDMLWRNSFEGEGGLTYNAYCTWIVDPPTGQSDWRMVSVANPAEWNFLCSGDFNGDGMNDIAMINNAGVVGIWCVADGFLGSWSILSAVDPAEWTLAGIGDFNADGTDDIAWQNASTRLTGYWEIKNNELVSWKNLGILA